MIHAVDSERVTVNSRPIQSPLAVDRSTYYLAQAEQPQYEHPRGRIRRHIAATSAISIGFVDQDDHDNSCH